MATSNVLPDLAAVDALAASIAPQLIAGDVLLLSGPMGAGKTTFTRALVIALGGDPDQVASPTFTLMHHYAATIPVVHVDAYRLAEAEELAAIGFDEACEGAIACVEWPERAAELFSPKECWRIALDHHDGHGRLVSVELPQRGSE
ncbi:MAG: tRNA (adenosine(37)-N6)-threonylcarbamoyltransferase complex ATPase subunit type 1 TsaE [Planctomycetota bacterium]|jgi:tRNA threonylcarbamoyl adenosine modification protein YjeE|nr:tRNA (adenosine(37)-N6)-threonylcarbamoyltransferase complex ATPase subunit type 1 TsaE [Planctomycetota bacterium]